MSKDNWADRDKGMVCKTCMFFVEVLIDEGEIAGTKVLRSKSRCRKRAPTMNGYPVVFDSDWCGDHKLV